MNYGKWVVMFLGTDSDQSRFATDCASPRSVNYRSLQQIVDVGFIKYIVLGTVLRKVDSMGGKSDCRPQFERRYGGSDHHKYAFV